MTEKVMQHHFFILTIIYSKSAQIAVKRRDERTDHEY